MDRPLSELSIEELIRRVREEEPGAMEELFRRCQPEFDKWARRLSSRKLPGGVRGSDVTQEAALRAFQRLSSFKGNSAGELFAWSKRIFESQLIQLIREAQSQRRAAPSTFPLDTPEAQEAPAPLPTPSQHAAELEELRRLAESVYRLSEDQSTALSLYLLRGLSMAEIARHMERSKDSVESLIRRAVRAVKSRMAGEASPELEDSPEAATTRNATDAAFSAYLRRCGAGEMPNPDDFANQYPECADELRGLLHWLERLHALRPSATP